MATDRPRAWTLAVDASQPRVQVGLMNGGEWTHTASSEEPPLQSIFALADEVLSASGVDHSAIETYVHCSGPGSTLGIRLSAMAIRTWATLKPEVCVYEFESLRLSQAVLRELSAAPFILLSDWKKGHWHMIESSADSISFTSDLSSLADSLPVYYLPQRKVWQQLSIPHETVAGHFQSLPEQVQKICRKTLKPSVFQHTAPDFPKWKAERHR